MRNRIRNNVRQELGFTRLEDRKLLAGASFNQGTGVLTVFGGAGDDILTISKPGVPASSQTIDSLLLVEANGQHYSFAVDSISEIRMYGFAGDDSLRFDSSNGFTWPSFSPTVLINGHGGDDYIVGSGYADTIYGLDGHDEIRGFHGDDLIFGHAGNDEIYGGSGNDTLYGGGGNDLSKGDAGNDRIDSAAGDDISHGGSGVDTLYSGSGNDTLYGDAGNDFLYGGHDDDITFGGAGSDTINSFLGNDQLFGDSGFDLLVGHDGDDYLRGGTGADSLLGGNGNDNLLGGVDTSNDYLRGDAGADRIFRLSTDTVADLNVAGEDDAVVVLRNSGAQFSDAEVDEVDSALDRLVARTGNNELLRIPFSNVELIFENSNISGLGENRVVEPAEDEFEFVISLPDATFTSSVADAQQIIIHEMGHSWHRFESGIFADGFNQFEAISGWTDNNPNDPVNYNQATGGNQWYLKDSEFATIREDGGNNRGRFNSFEDFATMWEEYFFVSTTGTGELGQKLAYLDSFFTFLSGSSSSSTSNVGGMSSTTYSY